MRWSLARREERAQCSDLKSKESHLGAITVLALDPTLAVELEAICALVEPVELWWRWVTRHRNTSSLLPAAILGALSLEGSSSRKRQKKRQLEDPMARPLLSQNTQVSLEPAGLPRPHSSSRPVPLGAGDQHRHHRKLITELLQQGQQALQTWL